MTQKKSLIDLVLTKDLLVSFAIICVLVISMISLSTISFYKGLHTQQWLLLLFFGITMLLPLQPIAIVLGIVIICLSRKKVNLEKMNVTNFLLLLLVIFLITLFIYYSTSALMSGKDKQYVLQIPLDSTTSDIDVLKKSLQNKFKYIKDNSGIFKPYNKKVNNILEDALSRATSLSQLNSITYLTSNKNAGLYPITGITDTLATFPPQLEQGNIGWNWFYGTFVDTDKKKPLSYFINFMRVELGNESIRKKMNLKLGETTMYNVGIGIGFDSVWYYTKNFRSVQGHLQCLERGSFLFDTSSTDFKFNIDCSKIGTVIINGEWDDYSISTTQYSSQLPHLNMKNGCVPCMGGQGTLYWSWTAMKCDTTVKIKDNIISGTNGDSWIDVQWGGANYSNSKFFNFMNNAQRLSSFAGRALGKYIWLNLHMPNNEQYMIYQFLDSSQGTKVNEAINCFYNYYSGSRIDPDWSQNLDVVIREFTEVGDVKYPVVYDVYLPSRNGEKSKVVTLDSKMFGQCILPEVGSNTSYHWDGGSLLYDSNHTIIGTGFLEASFFENLDTILKSQLDNAGVSLDNFELFSGGELSILQFFPSFYAVFYQALLFVLLCILFIGIIWYSVKLLKITKKNKV